MKVSTDDGDSRLHEDVEDEEGTNSDLNDNILPPNQPSSLFTQGMSNIWQSYKHLVRTHRTPLELADETISRLLFWVPHQYSPLREVVYGLLSLNRLSMHCSQVEFIQNSYGTSVQSLDRPKIPATSVRMALAVLHCIMPSILELVSSSSDQKYRRIQRQSQLRLRLEQLKFVLRLYLLTEYWKQNGTESSKCTSSAGPRSSTITGIMLNGGLYQEDAEEHSIGLCMEEMQALQERQNYIGQRTGLKLMYPEGPRPNPAIPATRQKRSHLMAGELLYALRPLIWAFAESKIPLTAAINSGEVTCNHGTTKPSAFSSPRVLLQTWCACLGMDLTSLALLSPQRNNGNGWSQDEWNRRRMRLFLYLLRAPIWSRYASPSLERTSAMLQKLPLLGGFADAYLWDWILYWKHPYVSEEG